MVAKETRTSQRISDSESSEEFFDAEVEITKDGITIDADAKELESVDDDEEDDDIVLEKNHHISRWNRAQDSR